MKPLSSLYIAVVLTFSSVIGLAQSDTLNRTDENGIKQGYWIYYGKDKPGKGYPMDGKVMEGPFVDDRKEGVWIIYHEDGKTPRTIGNFKNGRGNGEYTKYYEDGTIREEGTYGNQKQTGIFRTYHPNGVLEQEKVFNEEGKEDGPVKVYYDDGTLEYAYEKKDGISVGTATRYYPNGDVKEVKTYNPDGTIGTTKTYEMVNPEKKENDVSGSGGPRGDKGGTVKDGSTFKCTGYNKVYNENDELWMDGEFKNCRLWDGKLYKYDADGILLKIEIWKNGKYHSDGQLG